MTSEFPTPGTDYYRWISEVRDPAVASTEVDRRKAVIPTSTGNLAVEVDLAPVPGGWAVRSRAQLGTSACASPWRAFATRSGALLAANRDLARVAPSGADRNDVFTQIAYWLGQETLV